MSNERSDRRADKDDLIERYSAGQRINHWIVAGTFILLALSGLALFHPSMFWLANVFGGGSWTRILHPFVGVLMFVAFACLAVRLGCYNKFESRDTEWMKKIGDVLDNREENLPEVGRYNAGQKLLFYVMVLCMIGLLLSGVVIWRAYFSLYFPIGVIRLASDVHAVCAFVLICGIITHIYAAIWIKGSVRAMTRGTVTRGWAWKHHRAWYKQLNK
ncbi:formate dehydrogenase subunit gamma [Pandoraea terrigena]|uniref:Formate dehydrogenase n=1 Tax=Pandoraea terrigena TaxID=2508292 RepID=A0A5E4UHI9_9BURK|nr:formate dehydrogenase subunit gamma [Pandoraea terrigena]VVD98488.1 formate dehydrogenase [Pandoraea terrigena]